MLDTLANVELVVCFFVWVLAFVKPGRESADSVEVVTAPEAKRGILLQFGAFLAAWVYVRPEHFVKPAWMLVVAMLLAPLAAALAWWATRHLGKQWRVRASLNEDHELIQTGPYAIVRHPIYTSLFLMLLAVGCARTWWPLFVTGLVLFLVGNEIRIRAEDRLLGERFGESFRAYQARVPAFLPFVR